MKFVPTNDPAALAAAVSRSTAAIIAEPMQGEGGIRPLTPAFAAAINEACAKTGALFIADEVQSGLGRTGYPFYFPALGLKPHLVSVGKALGGGVPIGAALVSQEVADTISFGDHGSTYGGNLLACRAALCVLDELVDGGLLAHIGRVGAHFEQRLRAIAAKHSIVKEVRGAGLMWGLELTRDAAPVVPAGLARGVIVNRTAETVVRLLPPLVITESRGRRRRSVVSMRRSAPWELAHDTTTRAPDHAAHGGRRRREEAARADPGEPRGRPPAAADARRADGPRRPLRRRGRAARKIVGCAELAPLSPQVAEVRSLAVDSDGARQPRRRGDRRRAAPARAARRLREAVRVHARARLLHPHGLLDRAAPVAARRRSSPTA